MRAHLTKTEADAGMTTIYWECALRYEVQGVVREAFIPIAYLGYVAVEEIPAVKLTDLNSITNEGRGNIN